MALDISKVMEYYKFSFAAHVPYEKHLNLMGEALLILLHAALNSEGGLMRYSGLSDGYKYEVRDRKTAELDGYTIYIS